MLNLAIECSGFHGSVALMRDRELLVSLNLPTNQSSVQSLAVTISSALRSFADRPDFVSVTSGPGSFTGLRVGLATAKMLGMAWDIPIVPVDTLEVLAVQMIHRVQTQQSTILIPVLNAFRQQVFTAAWRLVTLESIVRLSPTQVIDADSWQAAPLLCQKFLDGNLEREFRSSPNSASEANRLAVAGPGLQQYYPATSLQAQQLEPLVLTGLQPQAEFVAKLGNQYFQSHQCTSAAEVVANYIRSSAAVEKLAK